MATKPAINPTGFNDLVHLIQLGLLDSAAKQWDQTMEDRFLEGAAWDQEQDREPAQYFDRD